MEIQRALYQVNVHMAQFNSQHCDSELIILFRQNLNPPIYTHCTTYNIQHAIQV